MTSATDYLRLALDPVRLAVLGHAAVRRVDSALLARALGVDHKKVLVAIAHLSAAGLLDEERRLDRRTLQELGAALPKGEPPAPIEGFWTSEEASILSRFFVGTRLRELPAHRAKRRVVLERLAQEFDIGVRYPERQVNFTLQLFHPDYASLRRHLVDEGFLTRADGAYWRTGGRT